MEELSPCIVQYCSVFLSKGQQSQNAGAVSERGSKSPVFEALWKEERFEEEILTCYFQLYLIFNVLTCRH